MRPRVYAFLRFRSLFRPSSRIESSLSFITPVWCPSLPPTWCPLAGTSTPRLTLHCLQTSPECWCLNARTLGLMVFRHSWTGLSHGSWRWPGGTRQPSLRNWQCAELRTDPDRYLRRVAGVSAGECHCSMHLTSWRSNRAASRNFLRRCEMLAFGATRRSAGVSSFGEAPPGARGCWATTPCDYVRPSRRAPPRDTGV